MSNPNDLLTWGDVIKISLSFTSSAVLIWLGNIIRYRIKRNILKRSVWNVFKTQTYLYDWMTAFDEMSTAAKSGNAYAISFDISMALSNLISELASLDPLKSDIYYDLLGKEEVVRQGIETVAHLQMELVKARKDKADWSKENQSLRKMISGQCDVLKRDVISMYKSQLQLMKHIQIKRDDSVDPVSILENSLNSLTEQASAAVILSPQKK